jgi:hypothetical protein
MFTAFSASTAKKQVGKQRDQVIPFECVATALTMTPLFRKALSGGKAKDADIQEAADHDPKEKDPDTCHDPYHSFRSEHRGNASIR